MMIVPQPAALAPRRSPSALADRVMVRAAERVLPAVRGAAVAAAIGLAAELALRAFTHRARVANRTVITEWVTIERMRRPS